MVVSEFNDIDLYSLPPEERDRILRDYEKFKKGQVGNPVSDFIRDAVSEFQSLLNSTNYEFAVKSTRKYLRRFQQLIEEELVTQTNELIGDYILKVADSGSFERYGVEFLMYTESYQGDALISLMIVNINHTITADIMIKFRGGLTINKREVIPMGTYAILVRKNIHTGKMSKKVYYLFS